MSNARGISVHRGVHESVVISGDGNHVQLIVYSGRVHDSSGIREAHPAADQSTSASLCPYKGLSAFEESDADIFYGRAEITAELWEKFRNVHESQEARIFSVLGPSGSGKSSLVRAGLLAELVRRPVNLLHKGSALVAVPGSRPIEALALLLARVATNDPSPISKAREFETELLARGSADEFHGLRRIISGLPSNTARPLFLVVDQFEEVFSICRDPTERKAFISNLLTAAVEPDRSLSVILTMRSDFFGALSEIPELSRVVARSNFLVPAMTEQELRRVISEPAKDAKEPLPASIVDLLISQTGENNGSLPLLEFSLTQIWEGRKRGVTPEQTLKDINGVGGALAGEADRIFKAFSAKEQKITRRLFLNLVQIGEGTRETKKRVRLSDVVSHSEDPNEVLRVVEAFARPDIRLITVSATPDGERYAEVTHEALFRHWNQLKRWVEKSREDIRFNEKVKAAVDQWKQDGRDRRLLWDSPNLDLLGRYIERNTSEVPKDHLLFYRKGIRRRQKKRIFWIGAAVVIVFLLGGLAEMRRRYGIGQEQMRAKLETLRANSLVEADRAHEGLSQFARLLRKGDGDTNFLAARILFLISQRNFAVPVSPPLSHSNWIWSARFSPDGASVVTASADHTARIWNAKSGEPRGSPILHHSNVWHATFSRDGKYVGTASEDGTAKVIEVSSNLLQRVLYHPSKVYSIDFSSDGAFIATASADGHGRIWTLFSPSSGDITNEFKHPREISSATFSPDGKLLLTACDDGVARLWDVTSRTQFGENMAHGLKLYSAQFNEDGSKLVTTSDNGIVGIWDTKTTTLISGYTNAASTVWAEFRKSSDLVASASADRTARIFDLRSKAITHQFQHGDQVRLVAFHPHKPWIATAADDFFARIFDLPDARSVIEPIEHEGEIWHVAFSPNGERLATSSLDRTSRVWNISDRKLKPIHTGTSAHGYFAHFTSASQVAFHRGTDRIQIVDFELKQLVDSATKQETDERSFAISRDRSLEVVGSPPSFEVISRRSSNRIAFAQHEPARFEFSPQARFLISRTESGMIVRKVANNKVLFATNVPSLLINFDPDERSIYVALQRDRGTIFTKIGESGVESDQIFPHSNEVTAFGISPDGKTLYTAGRDSMIRAFDLDFSRKRHPLEKPSVRVVAAVNRIGTINTLTVSTNGHWLLTGSDDGSARVWDTRSGYPISEPFIHSSRVEYAEFNPNQRRILTMSGGEIYVWELPPCGAYPEWIAEAAEVFSGFRYGERGERTRVEHKEIEAFKAMFTEASSSNEFAGWLHRFIR